MMNPMLMVWWQVMCRSSFDLLMGIPMQRQLPPPAPMPRSDMVEAMEEERDEIFSIRP